MDIQNQALIAEIERFKTEVLKTHVVKVWADSYENSDPFSYVINEENNQVWWMKTQAHQLWEMWQASKAQAIPEGFVLVKKAHPDAIVHNQGLGLFKECQVIYGWDGKSKDFKDALNKGFYHGVKLGAKAVLETAIIKAQEQKL